MAKKKTTPTTEETPTEVETPVVTETAQPETSQEPPAPEEIQDPEKEERRRRWLLLILLLLLLCCCGASLLFLRYVLKPAPLPQLLVPPQASACTAPTYVFSINEVDKPVGVAVSPDGQRIYAAESDGQRLVKIFNRDGKLLGSFSPPGTSTGAREPRYIAVDPAGRVFMVDRYSNAIFIFDQDGRFLDAIISPDQTLSKLLAEKLGNEAAKALVTNYDGVNLQLHYIDPQGTAQTLPVKLSDKNWNPLGVRFDKLGNLVYSDTTPDHHNVNIIPVDALKFPLATFEPKIVSFGASGSAAGQFNFPQVAVQDSQGNFYVSDGNNSRLSAWDATLKYRTFFGFGSAESALNLPRGLWVTDRDCLLAADAVGSTIRVYDVSKTEPTFATTFGSFGIGEGEMNYPVDLVVDLTGRLYVADRDNNRVEIWSY